MQVNPFLHRPRAFRFRRQIRPSIYGGFGFLGQYMPAASLVKTDTPTPGLFFRPIADMTVSAISNKAYGKDNIFKGIKAITNSAWNKGHIRYARRGYENYGFDGPQQEKKYDPSNPYSAYGSGSSYPTYWIPPLDTQKEPEQVFIVEPPTGPTPEPEPMPPGTPDEIVKYYKGDKGDPGQAGAQGAPGRPPTAEEIAAAVASYIAKNPPAAAPGPSDAQIQAAVNAYLAANPPAGVSDAAIAAAVAEYLKTHPATAGVSDAQIEQAVNNWITLHPPSGVTPEQINTAVVNYFKNNPVPGGPPGPIGPPGPAPSSADIQSSVDQWFTLHPPAGVSDAAIAAAVNSYMVANPIAAAVDPAQVAALVKEELSKYPAGGGTPAAAGAGALAGLATFAILGLMTKAMQKKGVK